MKKQNNVVDAQGAKATKKFQKGTKSTSSNVKAEKNPSLVDHNNVITTKAESKRFVNQYKPLPSSCKSKVANLVLSINNNDTRFKISQYQRESESGYPYYELVRYSARDNVRATREHIPAIEFVTKLINLYYNSNTPINIDINKLISQCESKISNSTKRAPRLKDKSITNQDSK